MEQKIQNQEKSKPFTWKLLFLLFVLLFVGIASIPLVQWKSKLLSSTTKKEIATTETNGEAVLGDSSRGPQIVISGGSDSYTQGGVIELASTDEPAVFLNTYNVPSVDIAIYKASDDALLDFLTHDKDGNQIIKKVDEKKVSFVTTIKQATTSPTNGATKAVLPIEGIGIWYLKITAGSATSQAFVVRSDIGTIAKEGDNQFIFWAQDFKTKKSVTDGLILLYNLQDGRKELARIPLGEDGIAKYAIDKNADIALVAHNDDRGLIPLNLQYLNYSFQYRPFQEKISKTRYFLFTDRPLYKPGDTVHFKIVLRDDDDARYTIPTGEFTVKLYQGYDDKQSVFQKKYSVSQDGTIAGDYTLSKDAKVGNYTLSVLAPNQTTNTILWDGEYSANTTYFDVEYFRKPEFSIDVSAAKTEIVAGDANSFTVSGTYFSGQPLIGHDIKYTVYSSDFYEYQYAADQQYNAARLSSDYRYNYWYGNKKVKEGTLTLDSQGRATIDLDTKLPDAKGKSQVFTVEATIADGSQNPSFARQNILVYAGEYGIYRKDYSYGTKVRTPLTIPLTLLGHIPGVKIANIPFTVKIHRESWTSYQEENKKYPTYRKIEEDILPISAVSDGSGNSTISYTPSVSGSYTLTVEGKDARENLVSKQFYAYVTDYDFPIYSSSGMDTNLTLSSDKQKYEPTDTAHLSIFSYVPDRDVFLSLERGRVNRFQVVHVSGKNGTVDVPFVPTDIPNMYAEISSFDDITLNSSQINLPVSTDTKRLSVRITPDKKVYGPGETTSVNIETTDLAGNPVSADVALWSVDKAIFELSDNKLGDIFTTYWNMRSDTTQKAHSLQGISMLGGRGGGCFAPGTQVLMADGSLKSIETIQPGEYIATRKNETDTTLVKGKVVNNHSVKESGYLILNTNIRVTANHRLWVNGAWQEAGNIQIGDVLTNAKGNGVPVTSLEWQQIDTPVYNLEVETYHTYFAGGVWVHNEKGADRSTFKDTAYWNPSIHTDSSGRAKVSFKLPDNLTTWTLAAVSNTTDTRVGQTTDEITVTKDVIVRPILPNMLRIGDEAVISALVGNFTDRELTMKIAVTFDSGELETEDYPETTLKTKETKQVYWKIKPTKETEKAKLTFTAKSQGGNIVGDSITQELPIRPFGFEEKRGEFGIGEKTYVLHLADDAKTDKSSVMLSLSPTLVGTLPTAMTYLIEYPFGCVEQTTSRFVPAIIAKTNSDLFSGALVGRDITGIIKKGIERLSTLQQPDGGWTWWFTGKSDPFITSYVVEYLLEAKQNGGVVDDTMIERAKTYLGQLTYYDQKTNQPKTYSDEDTIAKVYGLSLLGKKDRISPQMNLKNMSADILSLAVITNVRSGDTNPETNGLNLLLSKAQTQGDGLYWEGGNKVNFGSRDASTAWAIRAILVANGDRNIAAKAVQFLTRTRVSDYWSNTYATAQVIRALVDFSKTGQEMTPNYTYRVTLDGKDIAQGKVMSVKQTIKNITVPASKIKTDNSTLAISYTGDGQLYSNLLTKEFHTDKEATSLAHGLTVKREYINEKGDAYSLGVGDTVQVKVTVGGLKADESYGVISDELPAGLVPINESFKNEQYGQNYNTTYEYGVSNREVTENGEILSLYRIKSGEQTYTYRARVVSEGTYLVPPVLAALMYSPEIYGRSNAQIVKIDTKSQLIPRKTPEEPQKELLSPWIFVLIGSGITVCVVLAIGGFFLLRKKKRIKMTKKSDEKEEKIHSSPQE